METLAKASGATLGFIWNNVEGAVYGWQAAKQLYKWRHGKGKTMAPLSPPYTPKKRKTSMAPIRGPKRIRLRMPQRAASSYVKKRYTASAVTQQHDIKSQYRKTRRPKKQRKIWRKFVKKVQAVNLRDQGLITVLFNNSYTSSPAGAAAQTLLELHLYGMRSSTTDTSVCGANDLATIVANDLELSSFVSPNAGGTDGKLEVQGYLAPTPGGYKANKPIDKIRFESAVMEGTLFNATENVLEVDIYTVVYTKNIRANLGSLAQAYSNALPHQIPTQVNPAPGVINNNNTFSITTRGATPFDIGPAISLGNMKILKKEKVLLQPGQAFTQLYKDPKNRTFDPKQFYNLSSENYKIPGMTYTKLFIAKNVDPLATTAPLIRASVTRTYRYSYEGLKENKYTVFTI